MSFATLRRLHSPDLAVGSAPADPKNCAVLVQALVGPADGLGEESFDFVVSATPATSSDPAHWQRGTLSLPVFSWAEVERQVQAVVLAAQRPTWAETAAELNRTMFWEFDGYREFAPPNNKLQRSRGAASESADG